MARGNGEGTIVKRKDGRWCGVVTVGRNYETGKLDRKYLYGKSRTEVAKKMTKLKHKLNLGTYIEPSNMTVGEWIDKWLEGRKPHIAYHSWRNYGVMIRNHIKPELGGIKIKDLTTRQIQNLLNYKFENGRIDGEGGLSARTVKYIYQTLYSALKQAKKERLIPYNAAEPVELPKKRDKEDAINTYNSEQIDLLLNTAKEMDGPYYSAFYLVLSTGLRMGEVLGLKWKDINLKEKTLSINRQLQRIDEGLVFKSPKTKTSIRMIPLSDDIVKVLKSHKIKQGEFKLRLGEAYNDNDLVICIKNGKPKDPRNLYRKFKQAIKKAELPDIRFHDLRHTFATLALEAGVPAKVIQEILGHASISTTLDTYSHVTKEMQIDAAKKINSMFKQSAANRG